MKEARASNPRNTRLKPATVLEYNQRMGGVDHIDKALAPYSILRKSLKWYKKLAFHMLEIASYNSYIVYKHYHPNAKLTFKIFLLTLVQEILEKHKLNRKRNAIDRAPMSDNGQHLPEKNFTPSGKPSKQDCVLCRRKGVRTQTSFSCAACKKRFCIDGKDSCFKLWHLGQIPPKRSRVIPQIQDVPNSFIETNPSNFESSPEPPEYSQITGYTVPTNSDAISSQGILPSSNPLY